jgi:hypothetical protein
MGQEVLPSIDDYRRKEYQSATKSDFNFADAVVFREELGNGLARCQHTTRDAGHAYMVDTPKRHRERYGDRNAVLPPPALKVNLPTGDSSGEWRQYDVLKKIYEREVHWNAEALQATIRCFPAAMKEQKNDYGALPLNYTVRQALNFIESKVSDRVKKQKAYIDLMSSITTRVYVPSPEGPVTYLKEMEHDKHCIDILSENSHVEFEYSWDTLIINCQTKIRSSGKHNNTYLRLIEDKWENDILSKPTIGRWVRFKALYIEELQKLTEDGIDNTAMNVQCALVARVDAFESKYELDVQTLNNNQLTLETAFQASSIPSIVKTDGTGTVSGSISGTASSYRGDRHRITIDGMQVKCANNSIMAAEATDMLSLSNLPQAACGCHKFDEVTTPLISVGKLCDNDLFVLFTRRKVIDTNDSGKILIKGHRHNGLYKVPIHDTANKTYALPRVNCTIPVPTGGTAGMATAAS